MAEALVSVLLEQLRTIVEQALVKEVKLIVGVEKEVKNLTNTLTMIQGVLKDADEKQVKDEAVKCWLEQLKDVSYDADDVLDEWITKTRISKMQQPVVNAPIKEKACSGLVSLFCCFKPVVQLHEIGIKIRELKERLDVIAMDKERYTVTESRSQKESRPLTSSIVDVSDIYGRFDDKEIIVSKLLGESSCPYSKVPIISIVGTAGFGKTALARLILKDERVIDYFEKQMWVCVSDPFDHQKVAKQIIEAATEKVIDTVSWEALLKSLFKSVQGKRFILVLDDVWSYNVEDWNQLKTSLDGGAVGSRIIITTQNEKITMQMDSTYRHRLGQLSNDDSWLMFRRIAFQDRGDDFKILEDIAKDITRKCQGIPLSIKVLVSLLRSKKPIQEWRYVLESDIWDVQEGGQGFLPSILFSYYDLPSKLKSCLVYCSILPKEAEIEKKEMIELWMAQGYLGSDGSKDLEIEGGHYFDDLAMRSFFQDFEEDSKGNITSCKMHDLIHDFVQFLGKSETCILEEEQELTNVNVRHLSSLAFEKPSIYELKKLRTLRLVSFDVFNQNKLTHLGLLHQLACLRVLDLSRTDLKEFPSEVDRLLHLRYLNMSYTKLKELPETICNLLNLQTLKLEGCSKLVKLPKGFRKLGNLRHLVIKDTRSLEYLPQGIGRLTCLRTLSKFIIGDADEIEGQGCDIRDLGLLNHLQGELWIGNVGQVGNAIEAGEAQLEKKKNLRSLNLLFRSDDDYEKEKEEDDGGNDEGILEGLVPHKNLEELKVSNYFGTKLPDWISSLSNLVKLNFIHLPKLLQLPALGKLPFLEDLSFRGCGGLEIGKEFYGLSSCDGGGGGGGGRDSVQQQIVFPKLKKLKFEYMFCWKKWDLPYQNGNKIDFFPNLVELDISFCSELQELPPGLGNLKSLESLELSYMRGLKNFLGQEIWKILASFLGQDNGEVVLFPALKSLELGFLYEWEEETIPEFLKVDSTSITIMPCLSELMIEDCEKLNVIPFYMFSPVLKKLAFLPFSRS